MIKTEAGVNSDCMMAVDYAPPIKVRFTMFCFIIRLLLLIIILIILKIVNK